MKTIRVLGAATLAFAVSATAAEQAGKAEKPVVSCNQIVEFYKVNKSVDGTSSALLVDQARVAECLKAAGIATPTEDNR